MRVPNSWTTNGEIEAAVGEHSGCDQVKPEISDVFDGGTIRRLSDEVGETPGVVGVGIDGGRSAVANFHVLGESPGDRAQAFFAGRHGGCTHRSYDKKSVRLTLWCQKDSRSAVTGATLTLPSKVAPPNDRD